MPEEFKMVDTPSETSVSSDKNITDFAAIREKIFGPKKQSKRKSPQTIAEAVEPDADELKKLFAGENWEEISAMYFNARFAMTGYEGFLLEKNKKAILGTTLGASMKMLLKIDPGYIALTIFLTTYAGIIGEKEIEYSRAKKIRDAEIAKRKTA